MYYLGFVYFTHEKTRLNEHSNCVALELVFYFWVVNLNLASNWVWKKKRKVVTVRRVFFVCLFVIIVKPSKTTE